MKLIDKTVTLCMRVCPNCGVEYKGKTKQCSKKCRYKHFSKIRRQPRVLFTCPVCKTEKQVTEAEFGRRKVCSSECANVRRKQESDDRNRRACVWCKNEFILKRRAGVSEGGAATYKVRSYSKTCSPSCTNNYVASLKLGRDGVGLCEKGPEHHRSLHTLVRNPQGDTMQIDNVTEFVRQHLEMFLQDDVVWVCKGAGGRSLSCKATNGLRTITTGPNQSWKGWQRVVSREAARRGRKKHPKQKIQ